MSNYSDNIKNNEANTYEFNMKNPNAEDSQYTANFIIFDNELQEVKVKNSVMRSGVNVEKISENALIHVNNLSEKEAPKEFLEYGKNGQNWRERSNPNSQVAIARRNARKQKEENIQD